MIQYKPTSLEENYSNLLNLEYNFSNQINAFIWEYDNIFYKYGNLNIYNQLINLNQINPYLSNPEAEMRQLAYSIFGFTSSVFETLSYALDYWRIHTDATQRNRNITDKQYDQALNLLALKHKISGNDKEVLLDFRTQRNYSTHYGRIQFCEYIFYRRAALFNLIQIMVQLLGQMEMDYNVVLRFDSQQLQYIEEMKRALAEYELENPVVA